MVVPFLMFINFSPVDLLTFFHIMQFLLSLVNIVSFLWVPGNNGVHLSHSEGFFVDAAKFATFLKFIFEVVMLKFRKSKIS